MAKDKSLFYRFLDFLLLRSFSRFEVITFAIAIFWFTKREYFTAFVLAVMGALMTRVWQADHDQQNPG